MFLYCKLDLKQNRAFPERSNPKLPSGGFYRNEMARWESDLRSPPGGQRIFLHKAKIIKDVFGRDKEIKFHCAEIVDGLFHAWPFVSLVHLSNHINKNTVTLHLFFSSLGCTLFLSYVLLWTF